MTWHSLPIFVRLAGRPVILLGDGDAADAKRRLLDRAGAVVSDEDAAATLAIVAIDDETHASAAVSRLKARGILVNAVDRPHLCDWTLPAIVDRSPVLVAIGTGGVSAGLAAALRQRLERLLPSNIGNLANDLHAARADLSLRFPDPAARRRALGAALAEGGPLDPMREVREVTPAALTAPPARTVRIALRSADPDDLTLREARWLAGADRVFHGPDAPPAVLDRARADAARLPLPAREAPGLSVIVEGP